MEYTGTRRVQKFGRSTLMVSLPADWVKKVGLKPGDNVAIEVLDDGSIKVKPLTYETKKLRKTIYIRISKLTSEELVSRMLYAAYVIGFDTVTIEVIDGYLTEPQLKTLRRMARSLIGVEIVGQSPNKLTLQFFVDPTKYSLPGLIGRMCNLIKSMLQHLILGIVEKQHFFSEVLELETELDRVYTLSVRQLVLASQDTSLAKAIGIATPLVTAYRAIAKSLEDAGDALSAAAFELNNLSEEQLTKLDQAIDYLKESSEMLITITDRLMRALIERDLILANKILNALREFDNYIRRYHLLLFKSYGLDETYLIIRSILEKMSWAATSIESAAEVLFDISFAFRSPEIDLEKLGAETII